MASQSIRPPPASLHRSPTAHLPPVKFLFGTHNEDSRVEMELVNILASRRPSANSAQLRVLCVTGCGTHALTLCSSPHVKTVDAVDMQSMQIMISALTAAGAAAIATPEELAAFLGTGGDNKSRAASYRDAVRPLLPPDIAVFWDENIATIEAGAMLCGGAERVQAEWRARMPSLDPQAIRQDPDALATAMVEAYTLNNLLKCMPGVPAAVWERILPSLVPNFTAALNKYFAGLPEGAAVNSIVHVALTGTYPMDVISDRPLFLQPEVFAAAKALGCQPPRLRFHVGLVQEVGKRLAEEEGAFDLIDITNIFDLLPSLEACDAIARALVSCLKPGGALLCRWAVEPPSILPDVFTRSGLTVDAALNARLFELESSYAMTELCVGFAP